MIVGDYDFPKGVQNPGSQRQCLKTLCSALTSTANTELGDKKADFGQSSKSSNTVPLFLSEQPWESWLSQSLFLYFSFPVDRGNE